MIESLPINHLGPCLAEHEKYVKYYYWASLGAQDLYNIEVVALQ